MSATTHRAEELAATMGRALRDELNSAPPADWLQRGAVRMLAGAAPRRPTLAKLSLAVATPLLAAALLLLWITTRGPDALTFEVAGAASNVRARIEAAAVDSTKVTFSDGSHFELEAMGSLRVREATTQGATLALERGALVATVTHLPKARWSVLAGPYEILVVGTRFRTSWTPASEEFQVELFEGSVQIVGAGIRDRVELREGQRFTARGAGPDWLVTSAIEAAPAAKPSASSERAQPESVPSSAGVRVGGSDEALVVAPVGKAGRRREVAARDLDSALDWQAAMRRGEFASVVEDARRQGIDQCLARCSPLRLRLLADAARYSSEPVLAETALLTLRERSPADAAQASYLLGSLLEPRRSPAEARGWYELYLGAAPRGTFADAARAGRLRTLLADSSPTAVRAAATEYLQLHPSGVGAPLARRVLGLDSSTAPVRSDGSGSRP